MKIKIIMLPYCSDFSYSSYSCTIFHDYNDGRKKSMLFPWEGKWKISHAVIGSAEYEVIYADPLAPAEKR